MKNKMMLVALLLFNLLVLSVLCIWIKADVESHVNDDADLRTAWRYTREISYETLEQDRVFAIHPQRPYLGYIECILINLPENASGTLVVEIYEGERTEGKRAVKAAVSLAEITAGEWQRIPLDVWLSPSKTYLMSFRITGADVIPYLIYTNRELTIAEHAEAQPLEDSGQPVIAYYYGKKINIVGILTVLLLLACANVYVICRYMNVGQKKHFARSTGGGVFCDRDYLMDFFVDIIYISPCLPLGRSAGRA